MGERRLAPMQVGRALTYVSKQPLGLKRHLVGTLLLMIPILGWIPAAGYPIRVIDRIRHGTEELPPWREWADLFKKGLVFWLAWFTYNLPLILLNQLGAGGTTSPATLWSVVVILVLPAGIVRYVRAGRIGALYRFGEVFTFIRENVASYVVAWLVSLAAFTFGFTGMAATLNLAAEQGGALGLLSFLLVAFIVFWAALTTAHLFGTIAREDEARVSEPTLAE